MDTAGFQFLLFGLVAAVISNLGRSSAWRSAVILLANILFLALLSRNPLAFLPLAGFLLLGYATLIMQRHSGSRFEIWSISAVLLVYFWMKKYTVLPGGIFLHFPYLTLGLSYILFRVLHLLVEASSDRELRQIGFGAYLLYMLNFTTFVSGPIQRYDEFARDQFASDPIELSPRTVGLQIERFVRGFFKVNVLAMLLNMIRVDALAQLSQPLPPPLIRYAALRLSIVYPLFLYANFSGYIDIVIAIARLMRVRLPENFARPFAAASVMEFWNRWHITLSTWFKTYVFNPMIFALMRHFTSQKAEPFIGVFCFFITFFMVGIWHGRTSEFVIFGVLTGAGISVNKLWQVALTNWKGRIGYKMIAANPLYISFGRGLTFSWFSFTLYWFWADWRQIRLIVGTASVAQWITLWLAIWVGATVVLALWEWARARLLAIRGPEGPVLTSRYALVVYSSAMGFVAVVINLLLNQPAPGIVYKAF